MLKKLNLSIIFYAISELSGVKHKMLKNNFQNIIIGAVNSAS